VGKGKVNKIFLRTQGVSDEKMGKGITGGINLDRRFQEKPTKLQSKRNGGSSYGKIPECVAGSAA